MTRDLFGVVRSGSAELAVSRSGDGATIVLLHAGVADRRSWLSTVSLLPDFETIAYDRRGFGDTKYEAEVHSSVDDLAAVMNACGVDRSVLVGSSQGGRIAIDFALANPDRVDALLLLGSAISGAPSQEPIEDSARQLVAAIDRAEGEGDLDEVNRLEAHLWLDGPDSQEGRVGGAARTLFLEMNGLALRSQSTGEAAEPESAWLRVAALRMPVTVAVGTADQLHIRQRSAVLASRIGGSTLIELPGLGHLAQLEEPYRCAELMRDLANRKPQRT